MRASVRPCTPSHSQTRHPCIASKGRAEVSALGLMRSVVFEMWKESLMLEYANAMMNCIISIPFLGIVLWLTISVSRTSLLPHPPLAFRSFLSVLFLFTFLYSSALFPPHQPNPTPPTHLPPAGSPRLDEASSCSESDPHQVRIPHRHLGMEWRWQSRW